MEILLLLIPIIVPIIILVFVQINREKKAGQKIDSILQSLPDFHLTTEVRAEDNSYSFCIDDEHKKVVIVKYGEERVLNYDDIISVELHKDNVVVSSKSTMRTVGGAILGGALAGGAGMVVGGLSGPSKSKNKIETASANILVRDLSSPSICLYANPISQAKKIVDYLSVIIDLVDREEEKAKAVAAPKPLTAADQLLTLSQLKANGTLTEEEFAALKARIVAS